MKLSEHSNHLQVGLGYTSAKCGQHSHTDTEQCVLYTFIDCVNVFRQQIGEEAGAAGVALVAAAIALLA